MATLGFSIDTSDAANAALDLDKIVAAADRAERAAAKLGTSVKASVARVAADVETLAQKIERSLNVMNGAGGGNRGADIAAYGASLDKIRSRYDGLFAAQQKYIQNLSAINNAERVGAISASLAIDARIKEANAYNSLASAMMNVDRARKSAAQSMVNGQTITPNRGADITGFLDDRDKIRAKFDPSFAVIKDYKNAVNEIKAAYSTGVLSVEKYNAAMSVNRKATLDSLAAIRQRNAAVADTPASTYTPQGKNLERGGAYQTANITAQLQDIGVTAAMGMSPMQIALQQGTQLSAVFNTMERPVQGLISAFGSLFNLTSLVTIGAIAAGVAIYQWFSKGKDGVKTFEEALKAHKENVDILKKSYGGLGEAMDLSPRIGGGAYPEATLRSNQAMIRTQARQQGTDYGKQITGRDSYLSMIFGTSIPNSGDLKNMSGPLKDFQGSMDLLLRSIRSGKPDVEGFERSIDATVKSLTDARKDVSPDIFLNSADAVKVIGTTLLETSKEFQAFRDPIAQLMLEFQEGNPHLDEFQQKVEKIGISQGITTTADKVITLSEKLTELFNALRQLNELNNRLFNNIGPTGTLLSRGTTNREDMGNLALFESRAAVANKRRQQAFDAQTQGMSAKSPAERAAAAAAGAASEYNDETAPERRQRIEDASMRARIQAEYELSEAQKERYRGYAKSITDQQNEIDLIGKTGGELEKLRTQYELMSALKEEAARNNLPLEYYQKEIDLINQQAEAIGKLTDAYNQAKFNSDFMREDRLSNLPSSERAISEKLYSAGLPEDLNGQNAGMLRNQAYRAQSKEVVSTFFTTFRDNIVENGGKIGKSFADAIKSTFLDVLTKASTNALETLANQIVNAIFQGSNYSGASNTATGGVMNLFGIGAKTVTPTAANSNVASSALGVLSGAASSSASSPVAAKGAIADYIVSESKRLNIDPNVALRVAKSEGGLNSWNLQSGYVKNGVREQSYGPFQLYKGGGLGNKFMSQTGLDPALAENGPAATTFALQEASKSGWGAWYGAKKAGIGNMQGIGVSSGIDSSASSAAEAVTKLAKASEVASTGLGGLGTGLNKVGQSLYTSFFPSAPQASGGGGLFSWLGGLFGGGFKPIGAQAALASSGKISGLFAGGTSYAPGGMAIVGEQGPELVDLPAGSVVNNNLKTRSMLANDNSSVAPAGDPKLQVFITGAYGDQAVREMGRQGAQEALYQYKIDQARKGFGSDQQMFENRKAS